MSRSAVKATLRGTHFLDLQPEEIVSSNTHRAVHRSASPRQNSSPSSSHIQSQTRNLSAKPQTKEPSITRTNLKASPNTRLDQPSLNDAQTQDLLAQLKECQLTIKRQSSELTLLHQHMKDLHKGDNQSILDSLLELKRSHRLLELEMDEANLSLEKQRKRNRELENELDHEKHRNMQLQNENLELVEIVKKLDKMQVSRGGPISQDRPKQPETHEVQIRLRELEASNQEKIEKIAKLEAKVVDIQNIADSYRDSLLKLQANVPVRIAIARDEDIHSGFPKEIEILNQRWELKLLALRERLEIRDRDVEELIKELESRDHELEDVRREAKFLSQKIDSKDASVESLRVQVATLSDTLQKERDQYDDLMRKWQAVVDEDERQQSRTKDRVRALASPFARR